MKTDFNAFNDLLNKQIKMCWLRVKKSRDQNERDFWMKKSREFLDIQTSIGNHENWGIKTHGLIRRKPE